MTGDTNMKKENTINQEQEEMVFAEAPAQVIFNEKKEPDDIVEDDAEEIDEEDYEIEDDGDEEDDTPKNKFESCCVCHRTEEQGAKLIHMPTGLSNLVPTVCRSLLIPLILDLVVEMASSSLTCPTWTLTI